MSLFKVYTKNEGTCWMECNKYVKRRKGNMEVIATMDDGNGQVIADLTEKAKPSLQSHSIKSAMIWSSTFSTF